MNVARVADKARVVGSRPALASSETGSLEVLIFCCAAHRSVYRAVLADVDSTQWVDTESGRTEPVDRFGQPYWRSACSTCGTPLLGVATEITLAQTETQHAPQVHEQGETR